MESESGGHGQLARHKSKTSELNQVYAIGVQLNGKSDHIQYVCYIVFFAVGCGPGIGQLRLAVLFGLCFSDNSGSDVSCAHAAYAE